MGWLLPVRVRLARVSPWARYLLLAALPMAAAPWLLTSQWAQAWMTALFGTATALVCVWRYRTAHRQTVAWLWIGVGIGLNAWGAIVAAFYTQVLASSALVTPADALYLTLYVFVTIGLLLIVRARYPGFAPAKLLDAGVLTVGVGLLCWIFLIRPAAASAAGSALDRAVTLAYPVGDLMLLAILARLVAAAGWRVPAIRFMVLALIAFLIGDSTWAVVNNSGWHTSNAIDTLLGEPFVLAYALFGAAALHGSAGSLSAPNPHEADGGSWLLLALLTLTSLIAPAVLVGEAMAGHVRDAVAIAVCATLVTLLAAARISYLVRQVQRQARRLRELTLEDPLTGLPNRRGLEAFLDEALARARRDGRTVSVALIDLDHFKRFNDEYGHPAGDQLLKAAASAWASHIRETDMLARIGGEEFVLVLPAADVDEAEAVVQKLRAATPLGQTFSAGLALWDSALAADELLGGADAALYAAKRSGRDRTVVAQGSDPRSRAAA